MQGYILSSYCCFICFRALAAPVYSLSLKFKKATNLDSYFDRFQKFRCRSPVDNLDIRI